MSMTIVNFVPLLLRFFWNVKPFLQGGALAEGVLCPNVEEADIIKGGIELLL
jgi:hypothetical protein